jgi:hypothetical protein
MTLCVGQAYWENAATAVPVPLLCEPSPIPTNPPRVNAQCFLRDTVLLAAFESSHCCRDLSFSKRRNFFSDHALSFGSGLWAALGDPQTAK